MPAGITVVVPTVGRDSLHTTLAALAAQIRPGRPLEVFIVDDRPGGGPAPAVPDGLRDVTKVLTGRAAGPAAARNTGWRAGSYPWVAFLDDDVVPDQDWLDRLTDDLDTAPDDVGGVQGLVRVPLPPRRPTDWERVTAALADGEWITADMAYRRAALEQAGGFDERFPRAFREDAELAHRVRTAGWRLCRGTRRVTHPVRPESRWVSVRTQRGNADDALLRRMYGERWRTVLGVPAGRRRQHVATSAAAVAALGCAAVAAASGRRGWWRVAGLFGAGWLAQSTRFALVRIAPGPRDPGEVATMALTSAVIPVAATGYWLSGWLRSRGQRAIRVGHRRSAALPGACR